LRTGERLATVLWEVEEQDVFKGGELYQIGPIAESLPYFEAALQYWSNLRLPFSISGARPVILRVLIAADSH